MSLPLGVERQHILKAISEIVRLGGPSVIPKRRRSTKYDVHFEQKKYPPKYLISRANAFKPNGEEYPSNAFSGGDETNNFLIRREFQMKDKKGRIVQPCSVNEDDEQSFPEGKLKYRLHQMKERNHKLSKAVKDARLREVRELLCDVCGFSFRERYGDLGDGYIQAHHTVAISQLKKETHTKVSDFALVCANCHRMLHRKRPWLGMSELRLLIDHSPDGSVPKSLS
jgi:hypothetical protein